MVQLILSAAAAIVAGSSVLIGKALKAENSAKLYALTFLLVTFGASDLDSGKGAFVLAMTRITGIGGTPWLASLRAEGDPVPTPVHAVGPLETCSFQEAGN